MKRLDLSETDKNIGGVSGGIAEYLEVDSTVIRLAWLLISLFTALFGGVIAYLIAWAIIPPRQRTL